MSALRLAPSALVAALACARADATRGVRGAAARVAALEALGVADPPAVVMPEPRAVVFAPTVQRWTPMPTAEEVEDARRQKLRHAFRYCHG